MKGEPKPEKKESFSPVKLAVWDSGMEDKFLMIEFFPQTERQFNVYNDAIAEVCEIEGLEPFFQVGQDFEKGMRSAWEMHANPDRRTLEGVLEDIEKKAQEFMQEYNKEYKEGFNPEEE